MKKNNLVLLISFLISFISFSLLYFLLPFEHKNDISHILCYCCYLISLLLFVSYLFFHTKKTDEVERMVLSLPLIKTIGAFITICLFVTVLEYIVNMFVSVPFYVPLVLFLVLIGFFIVILGMKQSNIQHIEYNKVSQETSTYVMKELRRKSKLLISLSLDECTKANMEKIFEMLQYSDPVTNEKTEEIEKKISMALDDFEKNIQDKKTITNINDVAHMIQERNLLCQSGK